MLLHKIIAPQKQDCIY